MSNFSSSVDAFFNTAGKYDVLDHDQICALSTKVQAWQQHADGPDGAPYLVRVRGKAARDKMVRHNLKLIIHVWRGKYSVRIPSRSPSLLDAFQCAAIGLTRAAEKYQPSKSKFSTYATVWVHKGFRDFLCDDRLVRIPNKNVHLINAAMSILHEAEIKGLPVPSMEQVIDEISKSRKEVPSPAFMKDLLRAQYTTNTLSMSSTADGNDERATLGDMIPDPNESDEDLAAVVDCLKHLDDQERVVIEARYFTQQTETFDAIGKRLGVSKSQASILEKRALVSIRNLAAVD